MPGKILCSVFLLAVAVCPLRPVRARSQTSADAHARQILSQVRAALGGEAALKNIRSISGSGSFIIGVGENRASGQLKMDWLLPAMLMRSMKWGPMKAEQITTIEVVNGANVWTVSKASQSPMEIGTGAIGMGRGGSRRGGSGGGGNGASPAPELREDPDSPEFQAQMRADLNCLLIALSLDGSDFPAENFVYVGEMDIENVKTDSLQIKAADGITYTLAIDQNTHRPFMAGYQAAATATPAKVPMRKKYGQTIEAGVQTADKTARIEIYFSDYQPVQDKRIGQVWLPHQINKSSDGNPVEDFRIESFKLNLSLKPEQFAKSR